MPIYVQKDAVFCECAGIKSSWEGIESISSSIRMEKEVAFVRNPNLYIYSGEERIL
jgi:hypothetical protein